MAKVMLIMVSMKTYTVVDFTTFTGIRQKPRDVKGFGLEACASIVTVTILYSFIRKIKSIFKPDKTIEQNVGFMVGIHIK